MNNMQVIQGRNIHPKDIEQIQELMVTNPGWHRTQLSINLAELWDWRTPAGQLKDMAARSLLLKLEQRGWITLPKRLRRTPRRRCIETKASPMPGEIAIPLSELMPITINQVVSSDPEYTKFSAYLVQYHYVGYRGTVGENLAYLIQDRLNRHAVPVKNIYVYPLTARFREELCCVDP